MASEIRVNQIQNRSGLSTVTFTDTGLVISGITTISGSLNAPGGTTISAGSTSAPSISPVGDSNTGIFFPSADTVCIGEGGTEVIRVNSSGNVGIATNNPASRLHVNGGFFRVDSGGYGGIILGDNSANSFHITKETSDNSFGIWSGTIGSGTNRLKIDSSGRVIMPNQTAIELNGNNAADIDFTANAQLLTSTYYNQTISRGGISWNSSTGAITVPVAGYYFITGFFYCNTAGNGEGRIQIRTNGSNNVVFQMRAPGTNTFTLVRSLAANDTIDVIADPFDVPRLYMGPQHTRFAVFLLG